MNTITFKMQEELIQKIDSLLRPMHFNNRTEFIREAIRDKLNTFEREESLKRILALKGSSKTKTTDAQLRKTRREVAKKYI